MDTLLVALRYLSLTSMCARDDTQDPGKPRVRRNVSLGERLSSPNVDTYKQTMKWSLDEFGATVARFLFQFFCGSGRRVCCFLACRFTKGESLPPSDRGAQCVRSSGDRRATSFVEGSSEF